MYRLLILLCCFLLSPAFAARVAIIESYHADYAWDHEYVQGIEDVLAGHQLERFQLDTKRIQREDYEMAADRVWNGLTAYRPELVLIGDDNAFRLLSARLSTLNIPVVFLGLNGTPRDYGLDQFSAITGVFERPLLKRSVLFLSALLKKDSPRILVLFDASTTSTVSHDHLSQLERYVKIGKMHIDIRLDNRSEVWRERVSQAKAQGYDAIIVGLYHTLSETDGSYTQPDEMLAWIHDHTSVPSFGFWDFSIGPRGNVGGFVLDGYAHGKTAAGMAERILNGTPASSIYPVIDDSGRFIFSRSGMKKWQLTVPERLDGKIDWIE